MSKWPNSCFLLISPASLYLYKTNLSISHNNPCKLGGKAIHRGSRWQVMWIGSKATGILEEGENRRKSIPGAHCACDFPGSRAGVTTERGLCWGQYNCEEGIRALIQVIIS